LGVASHGGDKFGDATKGAIKRTTIMEDNIGKGCQIGGVGTTILTEGARMGKGI